MKSLDAAENNLLASSDNAAVHDHNFAVFTLKPKHTHASDEILSAPASSPRAAVLSFLDETGRSARISDCQIGDLLLPEDNVHHSDYAPGEEESVGVSFAEQPVLAAQTPLIADRVSSASSVEAIDVIEAQQALTDDWLDAGGSPSSGPRAGLELDHFLMRHYAERVCHLFCVIDTVKSPWKTIHLPRALQSMGELSVTGKTTTVRSALCNALLSISAWYLSNDHHRHQNADLGQRWADVAAKYGYNAIAMLKQAVESDMYSSPKPKYKEFLASMLSMVTINVRVTVITPDMQHLHTHVLKIRGRSCPVILILAEYI